MNLRRPIISFAEYYGGLKSQDVEKCYFCAFLEKRPLSGKIQNSVPKEFIATPIDLLWSNFMTFGRLEIGTRAQQ